MKSLLLVVLIASVLVLTACGEQDQRDAGTSTDSASTASSANVRPIKREHKFSEVMLGADLFQKNCARCHGQQAEGAPNWRQRGADGKYPAPPLNGTGHTWHHPQAGLINTIKFGTIRIGGGMPPWQGKLSDKEIEAILAWVQSRWPDDIYQRWASRELEIRAKKQ